MRALLITVSAARLFAPAPRAPLSAAQQSGGFAYDVSHVQIVADTRDHFMPAPSMSTTSSPLPWVLMVFGGLAIGGLARPIASFGRIPRQLRRSRTVRCSADDESARTALPAEPSMDLGGSTG